MRIIALAFVGKLLATLFIAICIALGFGPSEWAKMILGTDPTLLARGGFLLLAALTAIFLVGPSVANYFLGRTEKRAAKKSPNDIIRFQIAKTGWVLEFSPGHPKGRKEISFNDDGTVGYGRNKNEFRWRIKNGLLELIRDTNVLQNRFRYDEKTNCFEALNDPQSAGTKPQFIFRGDDV